MNSLNFLTSVPLETYISIHFSSLPSSGITLPVQVTALPAQGICPPMLFLTLNHIHLNKLEYIDNKLKCSLLSEYTIIY